MHCSSIAWRGACMKEFLGVLVIWHFGDVYGSSDGESMLRGSLARGEGQGAGGSGSILIVPRRCQAWALCCLSSSRICARKGFDDVHAAWDRCSRFLHERVFVVLLFVPACRFAKVEGVQNDARPVWHAVGFCGMFPGDSIWSSFAPQACLRIRFCRVHVLLVAVFTINALCRFGCQTYVDMALGLMTAFSAELILSRRGLNGNEQDCCFECGSKRIVHCLAWVLRAARSQVTNADSLLCTNVLNSALQGARVSFVVYVRLQSRPLFGRH